MKWGETMALNKKLAVGISTVNSGTKELMYSALILPATDSEIENVMQKVRITGDNSDYIGIDILSCPYLSELEGTRLECPTIEELNFFACRAEKLPDEEIKALRAIYADMVKCDKNDDGISMKDLINITYELDSVPVIPGIRCDEQLGEFVIDNQMEDYLKDLAEEAMAHIDKEKVGKSFREKENGEYINGFYVAVGCYTNPKPYDGKHFPDEDMPELGEGVFRLFVTKHPEENPEEVIEAGKWIALPIDRDQADEIAKSLGEMCIEDCVYYDMRTGIPRVDDCMYDSMRKFDLLNEIAEKYTRLSASGRVTFKALMEKESPEDIEDVLKLFDGLDQYHLMRNAVDAKEFSQIYLKYHLPASFDNKFINKLGVTGFGNKLLDRLGASVTDYGIISGKGRTLFEIVSYDEPTYEIQQNHEQMGGMQM